MKPNFSFSTGKASGKSSPSNADFKVFAAIPPPVDSAFIKKSFRVFYFGNPILKTPTSPILFYKGSAAYGSRNGSAYKLEQCYYPALAVPDVGAVTTGAYLWENPS